VEVLTAFIREHTKADVGAQPTSEQPEGDQSPGRRNVPTDIQAALTVLAKRDLDNDRGVVDLYRANLQAAYLVEANLRYAYLGWAHLQGAWLHRADLQGASLQKANLQRANLRETNLQGANLGEANLQGANLGEANLRGASLRGANLQGAVGLTQEQLDTAFGDSETKLPSGLTIKDVDALVDNLATPLDHTDH
jgi:uncharacterized protein YjbI with pentapeptide repeats